MSGGAKKLLHAAAGTLAASGDALYVDDVFSTKMYAGDSTLNSEIVNGIDLTNEGGLVWTKCRDDASFDHQLLDTVRGIQKELHSNNTTTFENLNTVKSFTETGYKMGNGTRGNGNGYNYVSWTFRKTEKFFDVVTWTGSNNSATDIGKGIVPHNLGVAPAVVILKNTTQSSTNWIVYHKDQSTGYYSLLNSTAAQTNSGSVSYFSKHDGGWAQTNPDANNIYVGYNSQTNGNTDTMVAYLFASDAGGFGDDGDENIINCGKFTCDDSGAALVGPDCGFEPQWVLLTNSTGTGSGNWWIFDNHRNFTVDGGTRYLVADTKAVEGAFGGATMNITSNGFTMPSNAFESGETFIYIAIRRPMKPPAAGTGALDIQLQTTNLQDGTALPTTPFLTDAVFSSWRDDGYSAFNIVRLTGGKSLVTHATSGESNSSFFDFGNFVTNTIKCTGNYDSSSAARVHYSFKRIPGFFDMVCYTGTNGAISRTHNLTIAPELMIVKRRDNTGAWTVLSELGGSSYSEMALNSTIEKSTRNYSANQYLTAQPTATVFAQHAAYNNNSGHTHIAFLFGTLEGISKVGVIAHSGTTNVACGFEGGARFVLAKRTDAAGAWYVWDSVRNIIAGNDPYIVLNAIETEVTNTDYIDPLTGGFTFSDNFTDGTYLFLAIA